MSDKLSNLPGLPSRLQNSDLAYVVRDGVSYKGTGDDLIGDVLDALDDKANKPQIVDLATVTSGATSTILANTLYYGTISANRAFVLPTAVDGDEITLVAIITTAVAITTDAVYRAGENSTTTGPINAAAGNHILRWKRVNSTWSMTDTMGVLNNLGAVTTPGATDDATPSGYATGSLWVNSVTKRAYICVDPSNGAAIWKELGGENYLFTAGSTTPVISSSTTETSIFSGTIPANTLKVGGAVRVVLSCYLLNNTGSGQALTLKVNYGSTTIFEDALTAAIFPTHTAPRLLHIGLILWNDGSTSLQRMEGDITCMATNGATTGYGDLAASALFGPRYFGGVSLEDATADLTLDVRVTLSATGSYSFTTLRGTAWKL